MDYSKETLLEIQHLASLGMTLTQTSSLLDIDEMQFSDDVNTIGHPARRAYVRGIAETTKVIRENLLDLAQAGAPSAINEASRFVLQAQAEFVV